MTDLERLQIAERRLAEGDTDAALRWCIDVLRELVTPKPVADVVNDPVAKATFERNLSEWLAEYQAADESRARQEGQTS